MPTALDTAASSPRRPVCTTLAACCPLLLLGLYVGLSWERGGRFVDSYSSRDYGAGFVVFGLLILVVAGLVLAGVAFGAWAVLRREQPPWAARGILVVNGLILLAGLSVIL